MHTLSVQAHTFDQHQLPTVRYPDVGVRAVVCVHLLVLHLRHKLHASNRPAKHHVDSGGREGGREGEEWKEGGGEEKINRDVRYKVRTADLTPV